jgi:hypothetical protein
LFWPGLKSTGAKSKQGGALKGVTRGGSIVNNRPSVSSLTPRYDDFLFAPICEEANGMRLSVLSALARMNVDPWEEATRLAAMPKAIAERRLGSTLGLVSGRSLDPSEAGAIAARLIQLLPQRGEGAMIAATQVDAARSRAQRTNYWLVWLGFAITISILSPHRHATTTDAGVSAPNSSVISPPNSGNVNSTDPNLSGKSH